MRRCILVFVAVAAVCWIASAAGAQALGRRFSLEELGQMVADATVLVRAKATEEPIAQGGDDTGHVWRIPFEVLEVVKGDLKQKSIQVHLHSPIDDLNTSRKAVPGSEYVLPLSPMPGAEGGRFRLVERTGFAVNTAEAAKLVEIARGGSPTGTLTPLRLRIEATRPPYESGKPALLRVIVDNPSKEAITYTQAPLEVREGTLYLPGSGRLSVSDSRGNSLTARETLQEGAAPPAPPASKVIAGQRALQVELDLTQYFDLGRPDNYMVTMALDSPDGKEVLKSNVTNIQVIPPLDSAAGTEHVGPVGPEAVRIPSPEAYSPGEPVNGLACLLKPVRAEFVIGEKMLLELRLINAGDQPLTVDCRLERTVLFTVEEQAGSPVVRPVVQRINWPEDEKAKEYPFAYLRPLAFWGKLVNVNSFYGRSVESLMTEGAPSGPSSQLDYERHGMTLFSFDAPGVYKIQASYVVKPRGGDGPKVWTSKATSNVVFVRVVEAKKPGLVLPSPAAPGG